MRFGAVVAYAPPPDEYQAATLTVALDGVEVTLAIPPGSDHGAGILPDDIAWLGQQPQTLAWLGYAYPTYSLLHRHVETYGDLWDLNIPYSQLGRVALGG